MARRRSVGKARATGGDGARSRAPPRPRAGGEPGPEGAIGPRMAVGRSRRAPADSCPRPALGSPFEWSPSGTETGRVLGYVFEFPRDHFAHPSFDSEWWYYTGNLFTADGRHFGFELTFFRRAREIEAAEPSAWDLDQVWLAHFTITDTREERFVVDERINRSGPGIAGADLGKRRIWNGNWSIAMAAGRRGTAHPGADRNEPGGGPSPHPRAPEAGRRPRPRRGQPQGGRTIREAVSHYLSFTRLEAAGTVSVAGEEFAVTRSRVDGPRVLLGLPDGGQGRLGLDEHPARGRRRPHALRPPRRGGRPRAPTRPVPSWRPMERPAASSSAGCAFARGGAGGARRPASSTRSSGEVAIPGSRPPARRPPAHRRAGGPHRGRAPARVLGGGGARHRRARRAPGRRGRLPRDDPLRGSGSTPRGHRRGGRSRPLTEGSGPSDGPRARAGPRV